MSICIYIDGSHFSLYLDVLSTHRDFKSHPRGFMFFTDTDRWKKSGWCYILELFMMVVGDDDIYVMMRVVWFVCVDLQKWVDCMDSMVDLCGVIYVL